MHYTSANLRITSRVKIYIFLPTVGNSKTFRSLGSIMSDRALVLLCGTKQKETIQAYNSS